MKQFQSTTLPSPDSVQLRAGGRFFDRYQGNIRYLHHLHDHFGDFMRGAFAERRYSPGKLLERVWDGEYAGKWLDSATRTAASTQDKQLRRKVDAFAKELRDNQQPDGFMGQPLPNDRELNGWEIGWNVWNQWTSMIGLLTHYEIRGEKASLDTAARIGDWVVTSQSPIDHDTATFLTNGIGFTNVAVIGQLTRLHRLTGNDRYLKFVGDVITHFKPIRKMLTSGQPHLIHPYMLSAVLTGIVDYAVATEDDEMLSTVVAIWRSLVTDHVFPTGSLGNHEDLQEGPLEDLQDDQLQETCATTEWIFLTQRLYEVTGFPEFISALERTTYNALLGAQSSDGMKWCYWTPLRYSKHFFHGPTRCCFWSGPRGIARLPQLIYAMQDNLVTVNLFESSKATLHTASGPMSVTQRSQFPEHGQSTIEINTPPGWQGGLRVRIPDWCKDFFIQANHFDQTNQGEVTTNGYRSFDLEGGQSYTFNVSFEIAFHQELLSRNDYAMLRGPEVLSVDLRDNIDTWLGSQNEVISIPDHVTLQSFQSSDHDSPWSGMQEATPRTRYRINLNDKRMADLRPYFLTPYADAGNDGAAFRTIFPRQES